MRESTFKTGLPKRRRGKKEESTSAQATQQECRQGGREARHGKDQRQPSKTRYSLRLRKSHILIEFVPANVPEQFKLEKYEAGWVNGRKEENHADLLQGATNQPPLRDP